MITNPLAALLMNYSEWLDEQGVIKSDGSKCVGVKTDRTPNNKPHDQLVEEFLGTQGKFDTVKAVPWQTFDLFKPPACARDTYTGREA